MTGSFVRTYERRSAAHDRELRRTIGALADVVRAENGTEAELTEAVSMAVLTLLVDQMRVAMAVVAPNDPNRDKALAHLLREHARKLDEIAAGRSIQ
jgi:hypothetical protein